jgi:aminoglycoside phosphotransferase (APT) family kinase protein
MIHHQAITVEALPKALQEFLGPIHQLTYPPQGYTSDLAIVGCQAGTFVVKRSRDEPYRRWLAQEYRVLQALLTVPLPIPRPYLYLEGAQPGSLESWLVMSYLLGDSLRTVARMEPDQAAKRKIVYRVGQTLAQLHQLTVPPLLQAERQESWLETMLKQARSHLEHAQAEASAQLLARLERQRPPAVSPRLIHGDFALDNVLIHDGAVSGIVDWAWGAVGDPRYDLALAIRPKEGVFQAPEDAESFFAGYGTAGLSQEEYDYFLALYEFV